MGLVSRGVVLKQKVGDEVKKCGTPDTRNVEMYESSIETAIMDLFIKGCGDAVPHYTPF